MPRAFLKAREPFSSYSHFIGAVLSGAGLFVLLVRLLFDSSVTGWRRLPWCSACR
mgnify:CR=1 FL=1